MSESPKLRPVDAFPVEQNGKRFVALRDPLGIVPGAALLPPEIYLVACHFDGQRSDAEIREILQREYRLGIRAETVREIARSLDRCLLLDNENFLAALQKEVDRFAESPVRPAFHAGTVYPEDVEEAQKQIEGMLSHGGDGDPVERPSALLAPHIDFLRGSVTYGKSYAPLRNSESPEMFVVLGTSHQPSESLLCLTRKRYATPFGEAATDLGFVEDLARHLPGEPFGDEFLHRAEHSVEFQIHFLKYLFPEVPVVPILCGGLLSRVPEEGRPDASPEIESTATALRRAIESRKRAVLVLGVDLAHVGPRFGAPPSLDADYLASIDREDRKSLEHAAALDHRAFFHSIADGGDPRKVCGFSPVYLGLRALGKTQGKLLDYRQCADPDQCVTIAGMIWS